MLSWGEQRGGQPQLPGDTPAGQNLLGASGCPAAPGLGTLPVLSWAEVTVNALKLLLWDVVVVVLMVLLGDAGPGLAGPNEGD